MPDRHDENKQSLNREKDKQFRLLSSAVDQASEGIAIIDMDGNLQYISGPFARMHGYEPEELHGKNLSILHTAEQMEAVENTNEYIMETGQFYGEIWHVRRDGTVFPTLMRNTLLRDESGEVTGILGTMRDITEQKRTEKELDETHERLQATLDAVPDLLFETDREGRIHDSRAPDPGLLYRAPEEFIGKMVPEVLPKEASDVIMAAVAETVKNESCLGETYSLEIGGQQMWFELSLVAKGDLNTGEGRIVALVRDITDRKRSEEKLRKMAADLKAERHELLEKNITLEQILNHLEGQKKSFRQEVWHDVEQSIMPLVKKLRQELAPDRTGEIENLITALQALLSANNHDMDRRFGQLTSRESEICKLIKQGMSSKEITEKLNLSLLTVHKHREQIRKKLGIVNLDVSLATFLRYH